MSKKFKTFIMSCLISVSTIGVMGTTSFADGIEGTERFIPKGEGEISISSENARSSGTSNSPHISSLSMGNQLINASYRSYPTGTHTISMKVVEKTSPNSGLPNYCMVTLQKYKLGGGTSLGSKKIDLRNVGKTYSASFTKQNSGKYRYVFDNRASTIGNWDYIDWFRCDPLKMYVK
ncbi:hypothetical protein QVB34_01545 [Clostridioides difficile]|nr:hypothetical protein [Clostridioides difficile]MDM0360920.1 hypothetical protein [Clostridioides difficile]MDM9782731.1 hypothetical protein [Clostridioides difficile]HBF8337593.1 hypothetical protein [Clostridioides difficile]